MTATQEYIAYLEWDESKIFEREIEYRIENWVEFYDARPSEDDVLDDVSGDCDIFRWEYEDLLYDLSELLKDWLGEPLLATVSNFGWRNSSGYANITAENAGDLLRKVLPNTDCTFRIWIYSDQVRIQNFHHDSPMGNEWYEIVKAEDQFRWEAQEYKNVFRWHESCSSRFGLYQQ